MHYIYMLDGLLKNEVINFEDSVTFVLSNNSEKLLNDDGDEFEDTIFYLKSHVNTKIIINLDSEKIIFSDLFEEVVHVTAKDGKSNEYSEISEISLNDDDVKVAIPECGIAFLINTKDEPKIVDIEIEPPVSSVSIFKYAKNNTGKIIGLCILLVIGVLIIYFINSQPLMKKVVLFEDETALMRVNLSGVKSDDIVVKTQLVSRIKMLLDEMGCKYIKIDLFKNKEKYDLLIYTFNNIDENVNGELKLNNVNWIGNISTKQLNPIKMYQDFNVIAEKYNLEKKHTAIEKIKYELIDLFLPNNNLRYNSIHEDLTVFYDRWGKNYIEFNVNLKENTNMPIDFLIEDGKQTIIKSGQGFYFN